MARKHVDTAALSPIAVDRAEAAAALGISVDVFDEHVRPHLPALRFGTKQVYPVAALQAYAVEHADTSPVQTIARARRAA